MLYLQSIVNNTTLFFMLGLAGRRIFRMGLTPFSRVRSPLNFKQRLQESLLQSPARGPIESPRLVPGGNSARSSRVWCRGHRETLEAEQLGLLHEPIEAGLRRDGYLCDVDEVVDGHDVYELHLV